MFSVGGARTTTQAQVTLLLNVSPLFTIPLMPLRSTPDTT